MERGGGGVQSKSVKRIGRELDVRAVLDGDESADFLDSVCDAARIDLKSAALIDSNTGRGRAGMDRGGVPIDHFKR